MLEEYKVTSPNLQLFLTWVSTIDDLDDAHALSIAYKKSIIQLANNETKKSNKTLSTTN